MNLEALIVDRIIDKIVIGMDIINELIGVIVCNYWVKFRKMRYATIAQASNSYKICDKYFKTKFDGK